MPTDKPLTVDEYIAAAPAEAQPALEALRATVRAAVPEAEEGMGWDIATYALGRGRFHFGYGKGFVSVYPGADGIVRFADELAGFSMSKGTARFPLADDPRDLHGLPLDLVARMAQWCLREEPAERAAAPHGEKGAPRQRRPMPDYVREALEAASLMDAYLARPPYQRNDYLGWITRPKREATRRAHLTQMLDELARGDVYMKMPWHGPGARTESVG